MTDQTDPTAQIAVGLMWTPRDLPAKITTDEDFSRVGDMRGPVRAWIVTVGEFFAPLKRAARAPWEALCKLETDTLAPAKDVLNQIDTLLKHYHAEKQAAAAAAAKVEAARLAEQRKVEAAKAAAAVAPSNPEMAQKIQRQADTAPLPVVAPKPATPKVAGLTFRKEIRYTIADKRALCVFCAAHEGLEDLFEVDMTRLRAVYAEMGEGFSLPGVTVTVEQVPVGR